MFDGLGFIKLGLSPWAATLTGLNEEWEKKIKKLIKSRKLKKNN